jgi:hypothetical protein
LNNEIFAIDPQKKTATKTRGKGQLIAVDAAEGRFVYTGIQKPIRDQLVMEKGPGGSVRISLAQANLRALMLKYAVEGADLKLVAFNDNAAVNGRGMGVSPDGKRVAMAGGGGWRSKTDARANYAIAVFDATNMQTLEGQVETGPYPVAIAFHPVLKLGAAYRDGNPGEVVVFNAKSLAKKDSLKLQKAGLPAGGYPVFLGFGGRGTKVVYVAFGGGPLNSDGMIELLPLSLTDQDRQALKQGSLK